MRALTVLCLVILLSSCAKRGYITGGEKDSIPPVLKLSTPKNFSTRFDAKEIKLVFDEYVKTKDLNKQLIVSPPLERDLLISPTTASKTLTIKIRDSLLPNTTYSLNFGQSIQDNNEGNPYQQFKYVFSTGDYIDSLYLQGKIKDAFNKEPDNFVTVMLYEFNEKYNDSTIYKEKPRYVTNTLDSAITFKLDNLKAGQYMLVALKDKNNNYRFDPKSDKIAFYPTPITLPDDAIYELELFKENLPPKPLRPAQASGNRLTMGYEGGNPKDFKIKLSAHDTLIPSYITKLPQKDSLQLWYPKQKRDSLQVQVNWANSEKIFNVRLKDQKSDTLKISAVQSNQLPLRDTFALKISTPLKTHDPALFSLINKDSIAVPFQAKYRDFKQELQLIFDKEPLEKYQLQVLPQAITDVFENTNDTLHFKFSTKNSSDYGNLRVTLTNIRSYPMIVQLTDNKGVLKASYYATENPIITFNFLDPALYTLRVIYDENANGKWDTGSFLEKKQTEEVIYFPREIDVRANWDVDQTFNLGG